MLNQNDDVSSSNYSSFLPAINVEDGLRRLMNNKKLYFKLLSGLKLEQMSKELFDNINNLDIEKTVQSAHTLRGVASNLALEEIIDVVSKIEVQAKAGKASTQMLDTLKKVSDNTAAAISVLLSESV